MNKAILAIAIILFSISSFAQKFDLQVTGYIPVVYEVDSTSAKALFIRAADWAHLTYKNPSITPADSLEGKSFIINAYAKRQMKYSMHKYDFEYKIYFEFKDNKYRINFETGKMFTPNGDESYAGYTSFFKKNGEIKYSGETAKTSLDAYYNTLAADIFKWMTETYLTQKEEGKEVQKKEAEW